MSRYNSLAERHEGLLALYDNLCRKKERRKHQANIISCFLFKIAKLDILNLDFSHALWHSSVENVTVYTDERLVFHFKNGSDVEVGCKNKIL